MQNFGENIEQYKYRMQSYGFILFHICLIFSFIYFFIFSTEKVLLDQLFFLYTIKSVCIDNSSINCFIIVLCEQLANGNQKKERRTDGKN